MNPAKFGFITLGANVPSTRFRFFPYQEPLQQRGHRCRMWTSYPSVYDHFPQLGWRVSQAIKRSTRWLQVLDARSFRPDTIYLERGCFHDDSLWMDERFRRTTPRLVLDVDDGIFLTFPEKVKRLIAMSDHVVVSNRPIQDWVAQYSQRITEIPTCVALERYRLRPARDATTSVPVLGWIGTTSNLGFLSVCAEALRRLAQEVDFTLLVVAPTDQPLQSIDLTGVSLRFERWAPETEMGLLHQMDIGLMPLPADQAWMRFKAATKLVQYMAIGIPAVASPIGVNADILAGNQVGFAATCPDEWFESLRGLLRDPALRHRMGQSGRQLAETRFSVEANLARLEEVLLGPQVAKA